MYLISTLDFFPELKKSGHILVIAKKKILEFNYGKLLKVLEEIMKLQIEGQKSTSSVSENSNGQQIMLAFT